MWDGRDEGGQGPGIQCWPALFSHVLHAAAKSVRICSSSLAVRAVMQASCQGDGESGGGEHTFHLIVSLVSMCPWCVALH